MKIKNVFSNICKTTLFLTFSILYAGTVYGEELVIPVGEWPPYIESERADNGVMSQIVILSFAEAGIKARLKFEPWKRVEVNIEKKDSISFGWYLNNERKKKWFFSDEIIKGLVVFAVRKERNIKWKSFIDLKQMRIGVTRGYTSGDEFDSIMSELRIDIANSDEINLKKLIMKRIDMFTVDPVVGAKLLRTRFSKDQREQIKFMTEQPVSSLGVHLVCSKNHKMGNYYIVKFNQGYQKIYQNGTVRRILQQAMSLH